MLNIVPYQSVGHLYFGDTKDNVEKILGACLFQKENNLGELELHYKDYTLIFTPQNHKLRECTIHNGVRAFIEGVPIDWTQKGLLSLCQTDGNPMEYYGAIILFSRGISLTGLDADADAERSLTAFSKGDWDDLKSKMIPFSDYQGTGS